MKERTRRAKQLRRLARRKFRERRLRSFDCPICEKSIKMKFRYKKFRNRTWGREERIWVAYCPKCGCCEIMKDKSLSLGKTDIWHKILDRWEIEGTASQLSRRFFEVLGEARRRGTSLDAVKLGQQFGWHQVYFAIIVMPRVKLESREGKAIVRWMKEKEKKKKSAEDIEEEMEALRREIKNKRKRGWLSFERNR